MGKDSDTNSNTYTENKKIDYYKAETQKSNITSTTWQYTRNIQVVPTNRTEGEIKIRIAPNEIPVHPRNKSTK